jgi:hypothetical protein
MRKLFEIICIFDWITPAIGIAQDIKHGVKDGFLNAWTFYIPYGQAIGQGWNPRDIERLLHRNGVETWGSLVHFGEYFFCVHLNQAEWAEYILSRAGVPIKPESQGAPRPENAATGAQQTAPPGREVEPRQEISRPASAIFDGVFGRR